MACGVKTYNGAIGLDPSYRSVTNLVELAEAKGMSTGLIATSSITHATPASFIAHQKSRHMHEEIASDFLKSNIDVVIGGGRKYFTDRSDEQSLIPLIKKNGYTVITNVSRLSVKSENRLFALVSENALPRAQERKNYLELATKTALNILAKNDKGFFLIIEGSQIDWAGHDNATDYVVAEMLDFDKAIGTALQFAAKDGQTLIICTADHETGGMAIESGNMETGEVEADFTSSSHTAVMVPVFSIGPNAEYFIGIYENNEIFFKIKHLLQL
jgi:alkaline phosphatase